MEKNYEETTVERKSTANIGLEFDLDYEKPGIGVIATENNSDEIVRVILRAYQHGCQVLVVSMDNSSIESVRLARRLGAIIVTDTALTSDEESLRNTLQRAAEANSLPGLIYHSRVDRRIDFKRSLSHAEEDSLVDSVTEFDANEEPSNVVVGIPAYNEMNTVSSVVAESSVYASEVVVVDDGSSDDTADAARRAGATVVQHETNRGYGAALKTAFAEADKRRADHLVILDADGQHDTTDIRRLVETQQETDADVVIGSRFDGGSKTEMPLYRRFGLSVVNFLTNLSMGVVRPRSRIHDTQSGFRAYSDRAIRTLAHDDAIGNRMDASTDVLYHCYHHDYSFEEIGTTIDYDVEDASSHNPVSHGLILVRNILKTVERERPIMSLGVPGFFCSFVGLGFGYWTFSNYLQSGTFPLGLAIVSAFTLLAGILSCFTAIILHALNSTLQNH
ncbi:glycosyltransferase family 2 protein [Haladaptatus cibarius]|uniref:glycosyltransferase family 2 protein n=1 Tax=Haladaptatus cibarius TaxID=453847 RepID=UPI000679D0A9|nr:glycosyltransferase family 2 protein [Haladaptatus cibarius]